MGKGDKRAAAGLRWPRAVSHLAIVAVFVLTALGYLPFGERVADAVRARGMRSIDHEAASAAVRPLAGVSSATWLDEANLAVTVAGDANRTLATVDRVCNALAPLGDTRAVTVHLRDATTRVAAQPAPLSRNCGL